ncbi:hypothetical protein B0H14DRAFT_2715732 [Mycena olivaceomarginata]|nr:hypothetical protein B0H14DRAFT_2715732 [Mycena olivaceomarginata]
MYIFSVIYLGSVLMLAVAYPIGDKTSSVNHPAVSPAPVPAKPTTGSASHPGSKSDGQETDILEPIKLTNETLPHTGIDTEANELEAKPQKPHNQCVVA